MKLLKFGLRFWITLTSVVSFIGGWIMLAHAPKPNQQNSAYTNLSIASAAPVPTLEPLPPLSDFNAGGGSDQNQTFFQQQPSFGFRPTFRTGGS